MAKHDHNQGGTAVEEQPKQKTGDKVEAEAPKAASTTVVDGAPKEKKVAAPKGISTYRIFDGVDASKFNGQRQCVVKSLQKLATEQGSDKSFTVEEIVKNTEGLVSKTPVEASVTYHLKGLKGNSQVVETVTPIAAPAATTAAA